MHIPGVSWILIIQVVIRLFAQGIGGEKGELILYELATFFVKLLVFVRIAGPLGFWFRHNPA